MDITHGGTPFLFVFPFDLGAFAAVLEHNCSTDPWIARGLWGVFRGLARGFHTKTLPAPLRSALAAPSLTVAVINVPRSVPSLRRKRRVASPFSVLMKFAFGEWRPLRVVKNGPKKGHFLKVKRINAKSVYFFLPSFITMCSLA
jgi:hypothetical protein